MKPNDCPKFETCSAPICPLDADWHRRTHLRGESVCLFLLESVKDGAEARLGCITAREVYLAAVAARPAIVARYGHVRRALERARDTGSRIGNGRRLQAGASPPSPEAQTKVA